MSAYQNTTCSNIPAFYSHDILNRERILQLIMCGPSAQSVALQINSPSQCQGFSLKLVLRVFKG